jgi:hypothetical protein
MGDRPQLSRRLSILIVLLLVWLLTAMVLNAASASRLPISLMLQSELEANYDLGAIEPLGAFRISIVNDIFRDRGYSAEEAEHQLGMYRVALSSPVPTATARNLVGDPPLTATPTITSTPTTTPTKTVPPTATRTKTEEPEKEPTATIPKVKEATNTPAAGDTKPPIIVSFEFIKPPGSLLTDCKFRVIDVKVVDPAFSSGIDEVLVKYREKDVGDWDSEPLKRQKGSGFVAGPGSKWVGHFKGSIELDDLDPGDKIEVYIKAKDKSGVTGWVYEGPHYYEMTVECDD